MEKLLAQQRTARNHKEGTLLVIEDNSDHWLMMKLALQESIPEIQTSWASGAGSALDYLVSVKTAGEAYPKLILLDLYLPERQAGLDFLRQLKANNLMRQIPVVILTSSDQLSDVEEAYNLGCASYVTKPVDQAQWADLFRSMRLYWWDTVTLPPGKR